MGPTGRWRRREGEILSRLLLSDIIRCEVSAEAPSFRTKHREVRREELGTIIYLLPVAASLIPWDGLNDSLTLHNSQQRCVVQCGIVGTLAG